MHHSPVTNACCFHQAYLTHAAAGCTAVDWHAVYSVVVDCAAFDCAVVDCAAVDYAADVVDCAVVDVAVVDVAVVDFDFVDVAVVDYVDFEQHAVDWNAADCIDVD